jgi:hypothetical protein
MAQPRRHGRTRDGRHHRCASGAGRHQAGVTSS